MHRHPDLPQAFAELGLEVPLLRALAAMKFTEPSPIQKEIVPLILSGKDVLGQARTGTGKTAAFGMPMLQLIDAQGPLQAVVLTPTRELAAQVVGEFRRLAEFLSLHVVPIYGGTRIAQQLHQLGRKPHVIVGTPGRVLDLLGRGALRFDGVKIVILDEVDRMLDIGFRDDIRKILGKITSQHQTIFVSATIEDEIRRLAKQYMREPAEINVSKDEITVEQVAQYYVAVDPWDKWRLLRMLLAQEKPKLAIIFTNTKHAARKLAGRLHDAGIEAKEIHGDLVQQKREKIMERFRKHQIPVLVATDLASRGIDVHSITHIINYDLPQDIEAYVHRIGRTARMGESGKAITLVTKEQGADLSQIEMLINKQLEQLVVEGFKGSPAPSDRVGPGGPQQHGPRAHSDAPAAMATAGASSVATPAASTAPQGPNLGGKYPVSRRGRRR